MSEVATRILTSSSSLTACCFTAWDVARTLMPDDKKTLMLAAQEVQDWLPGNSLDSHDVIRAKQHGLEAGLRVAPPA